MSDDLDGRLQRELELLALENQALRAHLASDGGERRIAGPEDAVLAKTEFDELQRARKDLRWVLRRIDSSPIGWLVRRRPGFRRLYEDWGE
jgi:hypothetical protein